MSESFDVLEACLQEVESGAEIESVLKRYPELADELRPVLLAAMNAKQMAVPAPSPEVVRRNRARLLQHAEQMRAEQSRTFLSLPRRWAVSIALFLIFLFSGTGIVRASSNSLPGDSLYSVKRSWESFVLFFTFDETERESLEIEHENERLAELRQVFATGRTARVDFAGIVTRENGDGWWISNFLVIVSDQTVLPNQPIQIGNAVRVHGLTRGDGIVIAERLELLPPGAPVPEAEDEHPEIEAEGPGPTPKPDDSGPGAGSGTDVLDHDEEENTSSPETTPKIETITGILTSISQQLWRVAGVRVDVSDAEIKGVPVIGALVKAEGYYGEAGVFLASKIEIVSSGSSGDNDDVNTNADDDSNTNSNENINENSNDNDNDGNSHGGDNGNDNNNNDNNGNGNDDNSNHGNDNG